MCCTFDQPFLHHFEEEYCHATAPPVNDIIKNNSLVPQKLICWSYQKIQLSYFKIIALVQQITIKLTKEKHGLLKTRQLTNVPARGQWD